MIPTKYSTPLTGLDWLEWYETHKVYHPGVDFNYGYGNDDYGQEVYAPKGGFVEYVHGTEKNSGGFGLFVILIHDDGNLTRYAHLKDVNVRKAGRVKEGDVIGHVGNTGTKYSHLHFEVFNKDMASIQSKHWRPWRFYPSGKTKQYVMKYYLNPWEWLKDDVADWARPSWNKALKAKVLSPESVPTTTLTKQELMVFFDRLKLLE
jgi:murein DD-endopeptidase MepM/ murein hydrolase activator NlpD